MDPSKADDPVTSEPPPPAGLEVKALPHDDDAAPSEPTRDRGGWWSVVVGRARKHTPPLVVALLALGAWFTVSYVVLDPFRRFLLPPPQRIIQVGLLDPENFREIFGAFLQTAAVALLGFGIATLIGMVLAIVMSQANWIERSIYPYAVILQTMPTLALVPLIGFWFGYDMPSRVLVCVTIALFPIITNTLFGLKSASQELHDLFRLKGAGRATKLWKLQLPNALPAIFTALRIAAGLSVIGAIVGDFFFRRGPAGIGRLLDIYASNLRGAELFTSIAFACLLGLIVFWGVGIVARRAVGHWTEAFET